MELVSIITPNYNKAPFLKEAIESVLHQTYQNWEMIIVDDHSTDGSWKILEKYNFEYPNQIKIYKNLSKGAQSARNFGFSKSSGKYIQWLDSDDLLGKEKIANQVKMLEKSQKDSIAFCGWAYFTDSKINTKVVPSLLWKNYPNPLNWLIDSWKEGKMIQTACWLIPTTIAQQCKWDEKILKNQDGLYFFNVLLKTKSIVFTSDTAIYYRRPGINNISQQKNDEALSSLLSVYKNYEEILDYQDTIEVREALCKNYLHFIQYIYPYQKDLINQAEFYIKKLNISKLPKVGGKNFVALQSLLGFMGATKFRYFLKNIRNKHIILRFRTCFSKNNN